MVPCMDTFTQGLMCYGEVYSTNYQMETGKEIKGFQKYIGILLTPYIFYQLNLQKLNEVKVSILLRDMKKWGSKATKLAGDEAVPSMQTWVLPDLISSLHPSPQTLEDRGYRCKAT